MALIERGANINLQNKYGRLPLHEAIIYNRLDRGCASIDKLIDKLIEGSTDINAVTTYGYTPLQFAIEYKQPDLKVLRAILENGADMDMENSDNLNALESAIKARWDDAVLFLLQYKILTDRDLACIDQYLKDLSSSDSSQEYEVLSLILGMHEKELTIQAWVEKFQKLLQKDPLIAIKTAQDLMRAKDFQVMAQSNANQEAYQKFMEGVSKSIWAALTSTITKSITESMKKSIKADKSIIHLAILECLRSNTQEDKKVKDCNAAQDEDITLGCMLDMLAVIYQLKKYNLDSLMFITQHAYTITLPYDPQDMILKVILKDNFLSDASIAKYIKYYGQLSDFLKVLKEFSPPERSDDQHDEPGSTAIAVNEPDTQEDSSRPAVEASVPQEEDLTPTAVEPGSQEDLTLMPVW